MEEGKKENRIQELDALRGIAALAVLLFHFALTSDRWKHVFNTECMGVDMFFIISGFVILMTVEHAKTGMAFVVSRFSRLYPAYWTCVTLTAISIALYTWYTSIPVVEGSLSKAYLANMTMLQYYFKIDSIDGPYWTLIIELVFYVFMWLLLVTKKAKHIEIIGIAGLAFDLLCIYSPPAIAPIITKTEHILPVTTYFPLFFSGTLFYLMKRKGITWYRLLLLAACFPVQMILYPHYHNRLFVSFHEYAITMAVIYSIFTLFLFNQLGFIVNKVTTWLGNISYSLYLIHQFICTSIIIPGLVVLFNMPIELAAFIALLAALAIATTINRFIEKPAMTYIRSRYNNLLRAKAAKL